ncbi:hypothetical protein NP233_g9110 [Leucocoprinus birnbaumii]|uniref:F-box domain-containing protein n=1 Tax=Leucocoprinus birnbaumii TaxID=56174 RepID=A0AAD5VNH3_9AGAR|nr:hypothetical protein NP233_g9110 [Leucocoprinus birnbaumii]
MTCPNCRPNSSMAHPYRFVGSRKEEIAHILNEASRVEAWISGLRSEKAALLRRLNALNSPISTLPNETLSAIFEFACPSPDFETRIQRLTHPRNTFSPSSEHVVDDIEDYIPFQLVLGAVSAHWRDVVQGTPRLWKSIVLDVSPNNAQCCAAILRLFFQKLGLASMSLTVDYSSDFQRSTSGLLIHETIDHLLIERLPRLRGLHLTNPPSAWFTHFPSLSQLISLTIDDNNPSSTEFVLPPTAPLRLFGLRVRERGSPYTTPIQLPFSGITSVMVSQMPFHDAVRLLLNIPSLIEFRCCRPRHLGSTALGTTLVAPVVLHRLRVLELSTPTGNCDLASALIQYLHVPSLRELRWEANHQPLGDAEAFFNRLPTTLTKIDLRSSSCLQYLPLDSSVEQLTLHNCIELHLRAFLESLREKLSQASDCRPLMAFPRLTRLSLAGCILRQFPHGGVVMGNFLDHKRLIPLFVSAMESRRVEGVEFALDMLSGISAHWEPMIQERLREMVAGGFNLKIREGSKQVPWL